LIQRIVKNIHPDGIDRRGFLGGMAWAGTGVRWTISRGIGSPQAFGRPRAVAKGEFSFVQISDSHIGFSRPANRDVIGTLERAVEKINALDRAPEFIVHTGDLSHNAQANDSTPWTRS
jgi:hypothetical protein